MGKSDDFAFIVSCISVTVLVGTHRNDQANALFVVYVETVLGTSCAVPARDIHITTRVNNLKDLTGNMHPEYYVDPFSNNPWNPLFYQNVEASIKIE